jgi:hypothetical protein
MATNTEYQKAIAAWQKAYPYLGEDATSSQVPSLGDYSDSLRKFSDIWARANPYEGGHSNELSSNLWIQGNDAAALQAVINEADEAAYGQEQSKAWMAQLTPEQRAQYAALKDADYAKKKRMGQAAFLAAAGGMALGGLGGLGAIGGEGALGGGGGIGALGGAEGLAAADIAGGLIPAFGTEAGYAAGLGGLAGAGGGASSGSSLLSQLGSLLGGGGGTSGLGSLLGGGGGTNWLNLLGNLGGGYLQSQAAGNATDAQLQAARESNALLEKMWQQGRTDQAPYREAGTSALAGIQALLKDPSSITTMPDYQFGLDQGSKALQNSATARGTTYSGQQAKALQRYGNDYAGTKLNESYNRLAGIAGIGQQATNQTGAQGAGYAGQMANNISSAGDSRAAGYIGQGNAWNDAIGGALNGFSEQDLINAWLKRGGG